MDRVRTLVAKQLKELDTNPWAASEAAGLSKPYLWQFLNKNKPKTMGEDAREKLAPVLKVKPEELKADKPTRVRKSATPMLQSSTVVGSSDPNMSGVDKMKDFEDLLRIALRNLSTRRVHEIMAEESGKPDPIPPQMRGRAS